VGSSPSRPTKVMNTVYMDFKEVYKPPFRVDMGIYGFSSNGTTTFTAFGSVAQKNLAKVVELLNGERTDKFKKDDIIVKKDKLFIEGDVILVRGWGKLIGSGGLNLPPQEAAKLQDDFIAWVVENITE
jgi:hypothetical protein